MSIDEPLFYWYFWAIEKQFITRNWNPTYLDRQQKMQDLESTFKALFVVVIFLSLSLSLSLSSYVCQFWLRWAWWKVKVD